VESPPHGPGADSSRARTPGADAAGPERAYLRGLLRALRSRRTYDPRANAGLWLGLALGLPIPALALSTAQPFWIDAMALVAPFVSSITLGAARRVALLDEATIGRLADDAVCERADRVREHGVLRTEASLERDERARLESLKRAADADLALARTIHATLVPAPIRREDLVVAVRHIPCEFIGGDYLHASTPRRGLLYLCVGDVSGHGVAAALVVSRIHSLVQRLVFEEAGVEAFLDALHSETARLVEQSGHFMTFAVFRVDLSTRTMQFGTAGHPDQLLLRVGGGVERLATPSGALGWAHLGTRAVRSQELPYIPGDLLVLFTDGLYEVRSGGEGDLLGEEGLVSLVGSAVSGHPEACDPEGLATEILRGVAAYRGDGAFQDDVCLLVARLGAPSAQAHASGRTLPDPGVGVAPPERGPRADAPFSATR
jgi:serine phosphatase RsbU (regulator of sigma subunit)